MPAPDFYIKEGDSAPQLLVTCYDEDDAIVDLTAALSVTFSMWNPGDDAPKIDKVAGQIESPATNGQLRYNWQTDGSDTEDPGDYDAEFEVLWSDGTRTTFPNFRYLRIKVRRSLDTTD